MQLPPAPPRKIPKGDLGIFCTMLVFYTCTSSIYTHMSSSKIFTVINRPERDPVTNKPRWNLIAREIGGVVVLNQLPEAMHRQNAVLDALGNGISNPEVMVHYASNVYDVVVKNPQYEVDGVKIRYQARTTFEALAFALADGSVPSTTRSAKEVPGHAASFLNLLTNGSTPEAAAAANGINVSNERQLRDYLAGICREFGAKNLYVALRLAHEHGVVSGRAPIRPERSVYINKFTAPRQVGFVLASRELELTTPELMIGRDLAAGLDRTVIADKHYLKRYVVDVLLRTAYKKLEAHNAAELVAKLLVLGLAEPPKKSLHFRGDITGKELSTVVGVAQGLKNVEIADELDVGKEAVSSRITQIKEKLGVADRVAAVLCMFQTGVFKAE